MFGSWQQACKEANIPFVKKEIDKLTANYHKFESRVGEEKIDKNGQIVKIIKYDNAQNIIVEYQDEYKYLLHTSYNNWKNNHMRNPYYKNIFGVACVGNTETKINGIKKKSYMVWYSMIQRCYKESEINKPTYIPCYVCDEWLCYENFEKWFNENYYIVGNEEMCLDKDILCKHNTLYCPEKCVFVTQRINKLFTKRQLHRGLQPIGVVYSERDNAYIARCSNGTGVPKHLGNFSNEVSAYKAYKRYKEKIIKEVADEYKKYIPFKLYKAMYEYEVEIDD